MDVVALTTERGRVHGDFTDVSDISQRNKGQCVETAFERLTDTQIKGDGHDPQG